MPTYRAATSRDGMHVARHRYFRLDARRDDMNAYSEWVEEQILAGTYIGFFAESHGQIIAGAGALLQNWGPSRGNRQPLRARIINVSTAENWRRQGLAFELVERVMQSARVQGITQFSLSATEDSRKLFQKLRFMPVELEMLVDDDLDRQS